MKISKVIKKVLKVIIDFKLFIKIFNK